MYNSKKITLSRLLIFTLTLTIVISSCSKKSEQEEISNTSIVKINISSVESLQENIGNRASVKNFANQDNPQVGTLKFSEDINVTYELVPVANNIEKTNTHSTEQKSGIIKAASTNRTPLVSNVKYRVLAYDSNGSLKADQSFTYGSESSQPQMKLDAGQTYTFISFSSNSTTDIPTVQQVESLNTAKLTNVTGQLMIFKETKSLVYGNNNLNVVFKHKFSSIITNLSIDQGTFGSFIKFTSATYKPTYTSADINLNNQEITYNVEKTNGTDANFETFSQGVREINGRTTSIIHPGTTTGTLTFKNIEISGETKDITVPNVKISPGVQYVLNLVFKTCTRDVSTPDLLNWEYPAAKKGGKTGIVYNGTFMENGKLLTRTINAPGADYGFVFNITKLDNAFNMEVNGVKLASNEIQFQFYPGTPVGGVHQNIRFKDGSRYDGPNTQGGTVNAIYHTSMVGTAARPLVVIIIGKDGSVNLYGRKVPSGPLYELELIPGLNSFNSFPWSATGQNSVKITQIIDGQTILVGSGSGKAKISCNP